jgi:hypothetical protein
MDDLIYTPEFYGALKQLVDKRPHKCKQCRIVDGTKRLNKDGTMQKFPVIVRLCVDDPSGRPNDPNNIAFFCTKCRKPDQVWKTPRRMKPSTLPQLFGGKTLLEQIQANARNKVPPKPPVLDDDGNEIPF